MIHVAEPDVALAWYESVFPGSSRRVFPDGQFSFLLLDGVQLEFVPADSKVSSGAAGSIVYWKVSNFPQELARFTKAGATLYRGPLLIESGVSMCQVRDPWGNCIGLRGPST
jgi:predicted enzyme related to lactoylglutathione lyase